VGSSPLAQRGWHGDRRSLNLQDENEPPIPVKATCAPIVQFAKLLD
jgi:hypothetical protein